MKPIFRTLVILQIFLAGFYTGYSQVPVLNSDPSAAPTIFLDFDGQRVTGTSWNWAGPIDAAPANLSASAITEIFERVSEDYRPFILNITTDSLKYQNAPVDQRMRVIVTATSAWYGRAGGVAFVGSFSWGDDTPGWIFSDLLGNKTKYVAEACSHEAGHTLGLQHQSVYDQNCTKTAEYNPGVGGGEIGWAPIMGVSYNQNLTTWHTGPSAEGCNIIQNDLSVITSEANRIKFRNDDHGNSAIEATDIKLQSMNFKVKGQISKSKDVDAFRLVLDRPNGLRLTAIPKNVGVGNSGADVDLKIYILNGSFDTVGVYNPSTLLDAVIDTTLKQGTYFITIAATGNAYHSDYGSLGDYDLTGTLQSILPIHQFVLKASESKGNGNLTWDYTSDEKVNKVIVESSNDGRNFHSLSTVSPELRTFLFKTAINGTYYRMKAITYLTEQTYYSNIVHVDQKAVAAKARVINTLVKTSINVTSTGNYAYQLLDLSGAVVARGNIIAGANFIDASRAHTGILLLHIADGSESWTEKLIKE